jgi:hypothetical protein
VAGSVLANALTSLTGIAFLVTLVLAFVVAGLDQAGIYHAKSDALGTPMLGLWAFAYTVSVWRYR